MEKERERERRREGEREIRGEADETDFLRLQSNNL